jgi:hypothetical protein
MPNRLAAEASPYLQQHAENPVDWYPWGDAALERAAKEDKPILLSIGYSACHWCHVMERESFADEAIARKMNELFVCIKVDREERPDLDHVYQLVVQLMGRSGGWPLTVFLTPARKPFFAGTYFPPTDRYGMPAFPKVLEAVAEAYRDRKDEVSAHAEELARAIAAVSSTSGERAPAYTLGPDLLARAASALARRFDDSFGGFGVRPKFPNTMALEILLRRGALEGDAESLARACLALDAMRAGGIWDQLGGGFHRYSTDEKWLVPHFEKMLYDGALLLRLYVEAFRATGEARYASVARDIVRYVGREMTHEGGAFFSSQDADSEGEEGKFFVWTPREVREALEGDREAADVALLAFGVTDEGNFEQSGTTVLHDAMPIADVARKLGVDAAAAEKALARAKAKLFEARERRPKPLRDEKILASWSALMTGALADAGAALGEPAWVEAARKAFAFLAKHLVVEQDGQRRVLRHFKDGTVKGPGFLDDHAFLADAALDLYEATGDPAYVACARLLADTLLARFRDEDEGGFYFVPDDGEELIVRAKDPFDHAIPSGTSIAHRVLLRLGALVGEAYARPAIRDLERVAPVAVSNPFGFGQTVCNLDRLARGSVDVVIVGARDDARTGALRACVLSKYLPNRTIAFVDPNDPASLAACPALAPGKPGKEAPVAYVCRGRTCSLPVDSPEALAPLLAARS